MKIQIFKSIDEIQESLLEQVLSGSLAAPRGILTRELVATGFTLESPRCRIIGNAARRWSLPLAVGEFTWHLAGSDDLEHIAYYAPIWRRFSEDGEHIHGSCYGKRIFTHQEGSISQWESLLRLLRDDPATRRAVLNFQQTPSNALSLGSKDVSCVTSCQILIRDGLLDLIVHMRSNDLIWGLPYDIFLFTMLQEMLSLQLGVGLGRYHHFVGSLHLYERHFDLAKRILRNELTSGQAMPPMTDLEQLPDFLEGEKRIRLGLQVQKPLPAYWSNLLEPIRQFAIDKAA